MLLNLGLLQYRYYEEEDVKFAPTYKYLKTKYSFDPEVSGWPDRIWYSTERKIVCSKYGIIDDMRDEHVPVFANFQVEVERINEDAQQNISEEVFERVSQARGYLDSDHSGT